MCLTFFRFFSNPSCYQLVLAFNRDEDAHRKTLHFNQFEQDPNIFAGRDSISKGTWLGLNIKTGLIVVLTNYDTEQNLKLSSRGRLVYKFLSSETFKDCGEGMIDQAVQGLLKKVETEQQQYTAFNLAVYNIRTNRMLYLNNQTQSQLRQLNPDFNYGLCNIDIDTIWDKTGHGLKQFKDIVDLLDKGEGDKAQLTSKLQKLMKDDVPFSQDPEKQSSIFVHPYYSKQLSQQRKTKSTTIILVGADKKIDVKEISYGQPVVIIESHLELKPV